MFPDVLDRFELGRMGGRRNRVRLPGMVRRSPVWCQPAPSQISTACAGADLLADLGEVDGHGRAIDPGRDDGGAQGPRRADRAEDVGRVVMAVANRGRTAAASSLLTFWLTRASRS